MSHWLKLPERGTNFALKIIFWVGTRIGRWAARLLLYPITLYFVITSVSGVRRGSATFLAQVLDRKPTWWDFARHIHTYSATILDRVFLLAGEFERFDINIKDAQVLLDRVDAGQGCILLGAHLGSFEVMRVLGVTHRKLPLKVLMNVDHNSRLCSFLDALNPTIARTVIPLGTPGSMIKVKESLAQGHLIGMLGDRVVADDKVVQCKFLGRDTNFPTGPMLLASVMQCPVILFFGIYRGGNRYDIYFEHLTDTVAGSREQQEQIHYWTQRYAARLEHYTRDAPYNWSNFYDLWAEPEPAPDFSPGQTAAVKYDG